MKNLFDKKLIAPCGMNCGLCLHYLRPENKCPGCYTGRKVNNKPIKCARRLCKKRCGDFCYECHSFPCQSIKKLDERYRKRYGMSEIENLEFIRDNGISKFLKHQGTKYICDEGGGIICVHNKKCYKIRKEKK